MNKSNPIDPSLYPINEEKYYFLFISLLILGYDPNNITKDDIKLIFNVYYEIRKILMDINPGLSSNKDKDTFFKIVDEIKTYDIQVNYNTQREIYGLMNNIVILNSFQGFIHHIDSYRLTQQESSLKQDKKNLKENFQKLWLQYVYNNLINLTIEDIDEKKKDSEISKLKVAQAIQNIENHIPILLRHNLIKNCHLLKKGQRIVIENLIGKTCNKKEGDGEGDEGEGGEGEEGEKTLNNYRRELKIIQNNINGSINKKEKEPLQKEYNKKAQIIKNTERLLEEFKKSKNFEKKFKKNNNQKRLIKKNSLSEDEKRKPEMKTIGTIFEVWHGIAIQTEENQGESLKREDLVFDKKLNLLMSIKESEKIINVENEKKELEKNLNKAINEGDIETISKLLNNNDMLQYKMFDSTKNRKAEEVSFEWKKENDKSAIIVTILTLNDIKKIEIKENDIMSYTSDEGIKIFIIIKDFGYSENNPPGTIRYKYYNNYKNKNKWKWIDNDTQYISIKNYSLLYKDLKKTNLKTEEDVEKESKRLEEEEAEKESKRLKEEAIKADKEAKAKAVNKARQKANRLRQKANRLRQKEEEVDDEAEEAVKKSEKLIKLIYTLKSKELASIKGTQEEANAREAKEKAEQNYKNALNRVKRLKDIAEKAEEAARKAEEEAEKAEEAARKAEEAARKAEGEVEEGEVEEGEVEEGEVKEGEVEEERLKKVAEAKAEYEKILTNKGYDLDGAEAMKELAREERKSKNAQDGNLVKTLSRARELRKIIEETQ